ncbi:MAG: crotonase/enoyl-CoA hydratase family protein [Alphaproteobacteria bacterium]|jgi:enoyl-CoA hydratase|nr:crotonase/enoyl-CoA hydratase family protein [Alphaproteobacteria bacterium]
MSKQSLAYAVEGRVARVTLDRPDLANAMTPAFWQEMIDVFAAIAENPEVRAVVIDAAGKHFSAGMDLSAFEGLSPPAEMAASRGREQLRRIVLEYQESFNVIERCRAPVLAAVNGACIGGGVDLVSACDIRYCTADAFFSIHETNIGMAADVGTLQRLPKLIPDGLVRELAYTGRRLAGAEARAVGLVNAVFDDKDAMLEEVLRVAETITEKSPLAVAGAKEMLNYGRDHSVADGLNYVATWSAAMLDTDDLRRGIEAQQDKRTAEFADLAPPAGRVRNRRA